VKALLVLLIATQAAAAQPSIGLFSDDDCGSCNLNFSGPGATATLYIKAVGIAPGDLCGGLTGAEFRVVGLPSGWSAVSTPTPIADVTIGDPFGAGANIGFLPSVPGTCITLFTVVVTGDTQPATLRVERHSQVSNPNFQCPILRGADPCFTTYCVTGGTVLVNAGLPCAVGVDRSHWTDVKELYK
jgi:hypothetical protein